MRLLLLWLSLVVWLCVLPHASAINPKSLEAIQVLNSQPRLALKVKDATSERCVVFRPVASRDELTTISDRIANEIDQAKQAKKVPPVFNAQGVDREAFLTASGDASRLLHFVYSDRVETQWFSVVAENVKSAKRIEIYGSFDPLHNVRAMLSNEVSMCDEGAPATEPKTTSLAGRQLATKPHGPPKYPLHKLLDQWNSESGLLNVAMAGNACAKRDLVGWAERQFELMGSLCVPPIEISGRDAPFSLQVVPMLFRGKVKFIDDNLTGKSNLQSAIMPVDALSADDFKVPIARRGCVIHMQSRKAVFAEGQDKFVVNLVSESQRLWKCLPVVVTNRGDTSVQLSADPAVADFDKDETPSLEYRMSSDRTTVTMFGGLATVTFKVVDFDTTGVRGIKAVEPSALGYRLQLTNNCDAKFPLSSMQQTMRHLEEVGRWRMRIMADKSHECPAPSLPTRQDLERSFLEHNSTMLTAPTTPEAAEAAAARIMDLEEEESRFEVNMQFKSLAKQQPEYQHFVAPGTLTGKYKTKSGQTVDLVVRLSPFYFSEAARVTTNFEPFARLPPAQLSFHNPTSNRIAVTFDTGKEVRCRTILFESMNEKFPLPVPCKGDDCNPWKSVLKRPQANEQPKA